MRLLSHGNSSRSARDVLPLIAFTALWTPNCGSTSINMWTWSGITSISMMSTPSSAATSAAICLKRSSTPSTSTRRRYFGHHTTWYLHE